MGPFKALNTLNPLLSANRLVASNWLFNHFWWLELGCLAKIVFLGVLKYKTSIFKQNNFVLFQRSIFEPPNLRSTFFGKKIFQREWRKLLKNSLKNWKVDKIYYLLEYLRSKFGPFKHLLWSNEVEDKHFQRKTCLSTIYRITDNFNERE